MDRLLQFLTDNKDALGLLLGSGVLIVLAGALAAVARHLYRQRLRRAPEDFVDVVTDPRALLPRLYGEEGDTDPLADHRVPYQDRAPGRDTQAELRAALHDTRHLLVSGPSGVGKTREAATLAAALMAEGWRVVRVLPDRWPERPAGLPTALGGRRDRVLLFFDDLTAFFTLAATDQSPRAKAGPELLRPSPHDRLRAILDNFDEACTAAEVRVIATARSEPDQLEPLAYSDSDRLWRRFTRVELPPADPAAVVAVLDWGVATANLRAERADFPAIAARNDGSFRNVVVNLGLAATDPHPLSQATYRDSLDGSWAEVYQRLIAPDPARVALYQAIAILRQARIDLYPWLVEPTARLVWGGSWFQRLPRRRRLRRALAALLAEGRLPVVNDALAPRDGQIEALPKSPDWRDYAPALQRRLLREADRRGLALRSSFFGLGVALYNASLYTLAIPLYERLIALDPTDAAAHYNLGLLLSKDPARRADAEAAYREAIRLDPTDAAAHNNLGWLLAKDPARRAEAEAAYQEAIRLDPSYAKAYNNLGWLLAKDPTRRAEAEAAYKEAIRLDPNLAMAHNNLGNLLAADPARRAEAEAAYQEAIRLDPTDAAAHYNLACLYSLNGDCTAAATYLRRAIDLNADHYINLAHTDSDFDPCRSHPDVAALLGAGGAAA